MTAWTTANMPSQHGRSALVTGTGGLGYETALALAKAGAAVVIAGRNADKGAAAVAAVGRAAPGARIRFGRVDLADLASIAAFAARLADEQPNLDLLVNNAAVMRLPQRRVTRDGFEMQLGTNYLGPFALTARLMPLLRQGRSPRVVTLSSIAARGGAIDFDDLQAERSYRPMHVYAQSKLACLMFALELSRRSRLAGWGVASIAAHPGITRTDLIVNGSGPRSLHGFIRRWAWFLFQPAPQGALPSLYAATEPRARDGGYYGPDRLGGTRGHPTAETPPAAARDISAAARLWLRSEELTGARFD